MDHGKIPPSEEPIIGEGDSLEGIPAVVTTQATNTSESSLQNLALGRKSRFIDRWALGITVTSILAIVTTVGGFWLYSAVNIQKPLESAAVQPATDRFNSTLLTSMDVSSQLQGDSLSSLLINGELTVTSGVVLKPGSQPTDKDSITGKLYYDKTTNQPYYYDGTRYVSVSSNASVNSINGQRGNITLGNGLSIQGGKLSADPLPQDLSTTATPTFAGIRLTDGNVSLGTALASSGAIAFNSAGSAYSVTLQSGATTSNLAFTLPTSDGANGTCLSTDGTGKLVFNDCLTASGPNSGVSSLNTLTGALVIADATSSGTTITINDASTTTKGIAIFNATNFVASNGLINTVQNIDTTATPSFNGLNLLNALSVANGGTGATLASDARINLNAARRGTNNDITSTTVLNTITPTNTLTIGSSTQSFILQGNDSSVITASANGFSTALSFNTPIGNTILSIPAMASGSYFLCTSNGNCAGSGGGLTTPGGTAGKLARFSGAQTLVDSIISDSGSVVTIAGAGIIQGAGGLTLGTASGSNGKIVFQNSTNSNTVTLQSGAMTSSLAFTLPVADGVNGQCLGTSGSGVLAFQNCLSGSGGSGGVTSLNGLVGVLALANSTAAGSTITLDDATTAAKGIARYNSTNFSVSSGVVTTIQDIATTSTPSFSALALTGTGGLTVGTSTVAGKIIVRDGNASSFASTFQTASLTADQTITIPNASGTICFQGSATCGFATSSGSGNYVQFAPGAVQTDATVNNSIFVNKTGASGNILELQKAGVDMLTVNNNGNVGLGVGTASAKLEVNGAAYFGNVASSVNGGSVVKVFTGNTANANSGLDVIRGTSWASPTNVFGMHLISDGGGVYRGALGFGASFAEQLTFDSAGKIGINSSGPGAQLQVTASSSSTVGAIIKGAASQSSDLLQLQNSSGTVLTNVDASGNYVSSANVTARRVFATAGGATDTALTVTGVTNHSNPLAVIKAGSGQTGDLLQGQDSTATRVFSVSANGSALRLANATGTTYAPVLTTDIANKIFDMDYNYQATGADTSQAGYLIRQGQGGISFYERAAGGTGAQRFAVAPSSVGGANFYTYLGLRNTNHDGATNLVFQAFDDAATFQQIRIQNYATSVGQVANSVSQGPSNFTVYGSGGSTIASIIQAGTSQTADMLQMRDSSGNINAAFSANGSQLTLGRAAASGTVTQGKIVLADGTTDNFTSTLNTTTLTANRTIVIPDASGTLCLQSSTSCGFALSSGGANYIQNGTTTQTAANFNIQSAAAGSVTAVIQGATSQTADILQVQGNLGTVSVGKDGADLAFSRNGSSYIRATNASGHLVFQAAANINVMDVTSVGVVLNAQGSASANGVPLAVKGSASQINSLVSLQDVNGAVLSKFDANGGLTTYGTNNNMLGLTVPTFSTASTGTAYYYQITATNAAGETIGSTSLGMADNTSALTWAQINGATGYKIYRNTTNVFTAGSLLLTTITNGATVTYTDTATATTAGFPPTAPTGTKLALQGWAGQTGDILSVQDTSGNAALRFNYSGSSTGTLSVGDGSSLGTGSGTIKIGTPSAGQYSISYASGKGLLFKGPAPVSTITMESSAAANSLFQLRGASAQSADLLMSQDFNGATLSKFDANGQLISYGTGEQILGLATPAFTTGSTGSSFYYQITATNAAGETVGSTSLGMANSTSALAWSLVPGATGYKIYRNTTNVFSSGSLLRTTITNGTTIAFTDNNAATTAGLPPTAPVGTGLVLKSWQSQTARALDVQNSAGTSLMSVGSSGVVVANSGLWSNFVTTNLAGASLGAAINVYSTGNASVGIAVQGTAAQTANLLQLQDSSANINASFNAAGNQLTLGRIAASGTVTQGKLLMADGTLSGFGATINPTTLTASRTITIGDASGTLCLQTSTSCGFANSSGSANYIQNGTTAQSSNFYTRSAAVGNVGGIVEGANGQTADLLRINTYNGTTSSTVAKFDNVGNFTGTGTLTISGAGTSSIAGSLGIGTTSPMATSITMANAWWFSGVDSLGTGTINMFQPTANNDIQVGAALNVDGGIVFPTDGGQITMSDMAFSTSGITAATPESYTMRIGSSNALTVYGENDGAGNAQNVRIAIGSSIAPAYTLDVGGDINATGAIRINGTSRIDNAGNLSVVAAIFSGTVTMNGHIVTGGTTPGIAAGAAACTTPGVSIAGNDQAGTITVTTGSGCAATGTLATISFASAYGAAPRISLTPGNAAAATLQSYRTSGTTNFTVGVGVIPVGATVYTFDYLVHQ